MVEYTHHKRHVNKLSQLDATVMVVTLTPMEALRMKLYGNASAVAQKIIDQFQAGSLPQALAPVFLHWGEDVPCRKWSWSNQMLAVIAGYSDARGVRQWNSVKRYVTKGQKATWILAPCFVKSKNETDQDGFPKNILVGFRSVPVFGYEQTDGELLPEREHAASFLMSLPLREVAEAWGIRVSAYGGGNSKAAGWYVPGGNAIGLGVENLSTWCHELVHCADDRLGHLQERGQHWRSEIVAELGGATLLCALGMATQADVGGAWEYISRYAASAHMQAVAACLSVLNRICDAVDLILTTAQQLQQRTHEIQAA